MDRIHGVKRMFVMQVVMLATLTVSADSTVTIDGVVYSLWPNENAASVKDGSKYEGKELHLPTAIDGGGRRYPLKIIGREAFKDCKSIEKIVIPEGVTTIHMHAFSGCSALKSIVIPRTLGTFYSNRVFAGCSSLQQIVFPSANVRIYIDGEYTIAMSIVNGFNNTFEGCTSLETFIIGTSDSKLSSMPVMGSAFTGCTALRRVVVLCQPDNMYPYDPVGEELFDQVTLVVPDSIIDAYRNAEWASRLAAIQPFSEFVQAGFSAPFGDDMSYTYTSEDHTLTVTGEGPASGLTFAPWECFKSLIQHVVVKPGVTSITRGSFADCEKLTSMDLPASVTKIEETAFQNCKSLESLTIPASVTSIGTSTFAGCSGLKTIRVEEGNPTYDSRQDCNAVIETATGRLLYACSSTVVPDGVKNIMSNAFQNSDIVRVDLPASVTIIGENAFRNCQKLTSVNMQDGVAEIRKRAFYGCVGLKEVSIPGSVKTIGEEAFKGCNSLSTLAMADGVESIGDHAFDDCSSLVAVELPNSITSLGYCIFWGCTALKSAVLPAHITVLYSVFKGCSSLVSVTLPDDVEHISYLFEGCSSLTSVTLPAKVKELFGENFKGCTSLGSMTCLSPQPPTCQGNIVDDFTIPLYVPKGSVLKYKAADGWRNFVIIREAAEGEENHDIWLTVNDGARGSLRLKIDEERPYVTLQFVAEEGWHVYSVMLDEEDVTMELSADGTYTTPAINADTRLTVVYAEGEAPSAIAGTRANQPAVMVKGDGISLNGLSAGDRLTVYTLDGHQVYNGEARGSQADIPLAAGKVYIVRMNDKALKVSL